MAWSNASDNGSVVYVLSDAERPIIGALLSLVAIIAFFGNVLVILAFSLSKKLRNTTNYFVVNLSAADLITSLSIPANVIAIVRPQLLPDSLCVCSAFSTVVCVGCGVYTLACIAVHRLIVVVFNRQRRPANFCQPALAAVILTWAVPITMASLPLIFDLGEFGYNTKFSSCTWKTNDDSVNDYSLTLALTYYPIPMVIITACYTKIFLHVRQSRRRINMVNDADRRLPARQAQHPQGAADKIQTSVTKNMFYVVCAFLLCMTPYTATLLLPGTSFFVPYAAVILMASTAINPTIYATKHPEFGKVMRNVASCNFSKIPQFVLR